MLNREQVEDKKANLDLPNSDVTKEELFIDLQFEYDTWWKYSIEEYNAMSYEDVTDEFTSRLKKLKNVFGIMGIKKDSTATYAELWAIQQFYYKNLNYQSDPKIFGKDDFWDTEALRKLLLLDELQDDCDSSYAIIELLYEVLNIPKKDIYRASCWTEDWVGHFVVWNRATDGVMYQLENRFDTPKTLKWYKDLGYEYVYYSPMTITNKWFKAPPRVATIIYNTPNNLSSDKARFSITKAFAVTKSKTLTTNWLQIVSGLTMAIVSLVGAIDTISYTTLIFSSVLLTTFGLVGVYLRTITDKDVDMKGGLNG